MRIKYIHPDTGVLSCIETDLVEACQFVVETSEGRMDELPVLAVCREGIPVLVSPITEEEMAHKDEFNRELGRRFEEELVDLTDREFHVPAISEINEGPGFTGGAPDPGPNLWGQDGLPRYDPGSGPFGGGKFPCF